MNNIIINADDFGYSEGVNTAIRDSFQDGLITSTTLMVNMPGFEEAVNLVLSGAVPKNTVGIHLNLFEGKPLTEEMKNNLLYCNGGSNSVFRFINGHISFFAPRKIAQTILYNELKQQICKFLDTGIIPSHLDSHGHYHSNWFVGEIVISLAKEFNIPYIRTSPNLGVKTIKSKIIDLFFNRLRRLKKHNMARCDFMGNIHEVKSFLARNMKEADRTIELMVHPIYNNHGVIIDSEFKKPLKELLYFAQEIHKTSFLSLDSID